MIRNVQRAPPVGARRIRSARLSGGAMPVRHRSPRTWARRTPTDSRWRKCARLSGLQRDFSGFVGHPIGAWGLLA